MRLPIVHHPDYAVSFSGGRHFPADKFGLLAKYLRDAGLLWEETCHEPAVAPPDWLSLVHCPDYIHAVTTQTLNRAAERRIGFPVTDWVSYRTRLSAGGAVLAGRLALQHGIACNTAGGSHHAHRDFGAGYCIFNDVAVAIAVLRTEGRIRRALVIDLDVHQGDGTAQIFADTPDIFTFSLHCDGNYPVRKKRSDLDVPLSAGCGDGQYLSLLEDHLPSILENHRPDLVFYNAGVDVHRADRLGKLALSDSGIRARDRFVLESCRALDIPVSTVMGGGYSDDKTHLARLHAAVIEEAFSYLSVF